MRKSFLHIAFWVIYLFQDVLLIFFLNTTRIEVSTMDNLMLSLKNCLTLLIPKAFLTYYILKITLPKMSQPENQKKTALKAILALVISVFLYRALVSFFIDPVIYGWEQISTTFFYPLSYPVALMDIGFAAGAAIALTLVQQQLQRQRNENLLVQEKLETELKFLRNQMNPHFLFNTLNNIYALARKKSDEAADAIMKLSKLLRFMLYESARSQISISEEIKMLENFIDLERIRHNDKLIVAFKKEIDNEQQCIAPLLLLPFVENAFKHGASESRSASFIHITLTLSNQKLHFDVENNYEKPEQENGKLNIGLNNVKRQLELLYEDYDLKVFNETSIFNIQLQINLASYAKNGVPDRRG